MNRAAMLDRLRAIGLECEVGFRGSGPFVHVSGFIQGKALDFTVSVPVRLTADHSEALSNVARKIKNDR